jgi:riboflavin-specific deaminase-like protein
MIRVHPCPSVVKKSPPHPRHRPRVLANFAVTADGKISTRNHTPTGFTSKRDYHELLRIRSLGDALLVGRGTLEADAMTMNLPVRALQKQRAARNQSPEPIRAVLSNSGQFDPTWKLFQAGTSERILFSTEKMPTALREELAPKATLHLTSADTVDTAAVLRFLHDERAVRTLVCEGGPTLLRTLIELDAIDELYLTRAPLIFGGAEAPTLTGTNPAFLERVTRAKLVSLEIHADEAFCHYTFS